jgi:hypothetical protein
LDRASTRYRLAVVVLLEARFLVLDVWLVDFFEVGFAVVPLDLEVDLSTVLAGVLLVEREGVLADRLAALRPNAPVEAIASIRGAGFFFAGVAARTCLIALVCSSSVIRNSWWPSGLATKYR